jgi:hypothetical protein
LHLLNLNGRTAARLRNGYAERHLHTVDIAIIGVVDLRGIQAEWRVGVANRAQQQI